MLPILCAGRCEKTKAAYHGVGALLAAGACVYNGAAWVTRRERHLVLNALVYGWIAWFEWRRMQGHRRCR